jgi:hypothetical protein
MRLEKLRGRLEIGNAERIQPGIVLRRSEALVRADSASILSTRPQLP